MLYSKKAQSAGGSGFYFDGDPGAPGDAFEVAQADVNAAVNLPSGVAFTFNAPAGDATIGTLVVVPAQGPTAAQLLAQAQHARFVVINAACAAAITAGFMSSALGVPHTYPAKQTDQQNLSASVLASMYPNLPASWTTPFWCADGNGLWEWVDHTAAQIQQAGADAKVAILACMSKNATLQAQILAAADVATVQKISWS